MLRLAIAASFAILGVPASVRARTDTLWTRDTSMTERAIVGAVLELALGVELTPQPPVDDIAKGMAVDASTRVGTRIPRWKRRYP